MLLFTRPLLLLLLLPVAVGLIATYRPLGGMTRWRKTIAFSIRGVLCTLLVAALAGPEMKRQNLGSCTFFVLDRSDSISDKDKDSQIEFVNAALARLTPNDVAGIVAFGAEPAVETITGKLHRIEKVQSTIDGSGSDLAAAIRLASASFPEGKARRIVVLSDGNETDGDAAEAALVCGTDSVPIDIVAFGSTRDKPEVSVVGLEVPSEGRIDEAFALKVGVDSSSNTSATINLSRDGVHLKAMTVRLQPGSNTFAMTDSIQSEGFHRYEVDLSSEADGDERNNRGMSFIAVRGQARILVAQSGPEHNELASALRKQGLIVDLFGPSQLPVQAYDLQEYDAVILNDLNAQVMDQRVMKLLQAAVRDAGVGLAMVGGEDSFLPGGWYGTPVAEALPVDLNVRQRKSFPSTTILIVCDTSGSMGMLEDGIPKVRLAAKAAEQTVMMMSPQDKVGVVGSTDGIEYCAPLQRCLDKESIVAQIRRLGVGGGGIYCEPSMRFASDVLRADDAKVRHLILLADGADCDLQEGCLQIALEMRALRITTTCVAIGDGPHVSFLRALAAVGGGRFYLAKKASQLPAIFTQDAAIMSRSAIEEGAFYPRVASGEAIAEGIGSFPALLAYCLVDQRPLSKVGMRTHKEDPLLATWQYGLGKSLAFTSDAKARWAAQWVNWGGYGKFWGQAVRSISRRVTNNTYEIAVSQVGSKGEVTVTARDPAGNPVNAPPEAVRLSHPNGDTSSLVVSQTGPGEFKGAFAATNVGAYIVTVAEADPSGARVSSSGFSVAYPAEYRAYRPNKGVLASITESSGGQELTSPSEAARPATTPGYSLQEMWAKFLLAAVFLLPVDIGVRRIALPVSEILANVSRWRRSRRASSAVPEHVEKLRLAKMRAQKEPGTAPDQPLVVLAPPQSPPQDPKPAPQSSASSALLEAKKRRTSSSDPE